MARRDADFYSTARKRFTAAKSAFADIREEAAKDFRMVAGDQWDPSVKQARDNAQRPALTFNRLHNLVQYIANQVRQNKPAVKINPVSSGARQETAKVFEGIIRHIHYASQADVAHDHAAECSAGGSFGYYRVNTVYVDEDGFDQDIRIERILDPMTVYFDPNALEPGYSDAKYCFVREPLAWDEYRRRYPGAAMSSFGEGQDPSWAKEETVWTAQYWTVETTKRTLVQLSGGLRGFKDAEEIKAAIQDDHQLIVREREVEERQVYVDLINGVESLDRTEWLGNWIPIIPVLGREMMVDGKRQLFSLVRFARDPQKLLNGYKSGIAEQIGLANRIPYIGAKGQFKDEKWRDANIQNYAYLEYDPIAIGGAPAPPPQRQQFEAPIQALSVAAAQEADDIKAAANIFDSSLGSASAEYSGISVLRRTQQADLTNFHFSDNLTRALWMEGRILLDLIPKVYDTARAVRILGEDGTVSEAMVTQALEDGRVPTVPGREDQPHHRLDVGLYDVAVTTGPSYSTRRLETFDMLSQFAQKYPPLLQIAGDLIFKNSDIPGADELADRFKLMLPPPIAATLNKDQPDPQQIAQIGAENQALKQQLQQLLIEKQSKLLELNTKREIALLQSQTQLTVADLKTRSEEAQMLLESELESVRHQLDMLQTSADQQFEAASPAPQGEPVQ